MQKTTIEETNNQKQQGTPAAPSLSDQIASAALSAFASLPKTGKCQPHEHTAFAAIAITFPPESHAATCLGLPTSTDKSCTSPLIIAMATGTKCLPGSKRAADGSALNDCHAEVLARRAFLRWMYDEIQYAAQREQKQQGMPLTTLTPPPPTSLVFSIWEERDPEYTRWWVELFKGVKIHMFTSHPPCGDATIGSTAAGGGAGGAGGAAAVAAAGPSCGCEGKTADIDTTTANNGGVGRTGAKPLIKRQKLDTSDPDNEQKQEEQTTTTAAETNVPTAKADWVLPQAHDVESYTSAQATGIVRRKPGRGEPTLSVSCSDKIAKWSLLGIQGSLLSSFLLGPLYLSSLVVGAPSSPSASEEKNDSSHIEATTKESRISNVEMTEKALKRAFQERIKDIPPLYSPLTPPANFETHAVALDQSELDTLGLLAGEVRKVPCGTSITWRAAPSAQWRLKPAKHQWGSSGSGGGSGGITAATSAPLNMVTSEGFSEAITGLFGSKAGAARRGADPVPLERQSALCRAALFKRYFEIARTLNVEIETDNIDDEGLPRTFSMLYKAAKEEAGSGIRYTSRWKELINGTTTTTTTTEAPGAEAPAEAPSSSHSPFEGWIVKPIL